MSRFTRSRAAALFLFVALAATAPCARALAAPISEAVPIPPESGAVDAAHVAHTSDTFAMLTVFMLSSFIGIGVIRRVSRLLHTPLMSLTNAISAITVVGAIIVAGGEGYPTPIRILGSIALFASMTNIISGFMITDRMLKMFKPKVEAKS